MEALLKILLDIISEKRTAAELLMKQFANANEPNELTAKFASEYKAQFEAYCEMYATIGYFLDLIREVQSHE